MKIIGILMIITMILTGFTSDKPAYKLFDKNGKAVKYEKMIKALNKADIIFIGELHNNPISHWAEYEITKDLIKLNSGGLVLGAEMFEADNQLIMDEYLDSIITVKKFEAEMRLWPNYKTDYKPLVELAAKNNLRFIATNVPRRYANLVYRKGFEGLETLSDEAKKYLPPLPVTYDSAVSCYANMLKDMRDSEHFNENIAKSQALKDATMAHFILKNTENGKKFIHYNGAYHSDNYEGIVWYIKNQNPNLKILTVSVAEQSSVDKLYDENKNKADYIFAVPESMTKTY